MASECFLCSPNKKLVIFNKKPLYSMVGLGPITDRYIMIASVAHVRSFADMLLEDNDAAASVTNIRKRLQSDGSQLTMAEHGRVPLCREDGGEHDKHCFHAHMLLFSTTNDISKLAASYFSNFREFTSLFEALSYASTVVNYHLLSPSNERFIVFSGPLNVPPQFFRALISATEGCGDEADWRTSPRQERALCMAEHERKRLKSNNDSI
jgi:hypothetical protein